VAGIGGECGLDDQEWENAGKTQRLVDLGIWTAKDAEKLGAAFARNQSDPTDFKSVVRVTLHYIENEQ
jgi:hypothetical protein